MNGANDNLPSRQPPRPPAPVTPEDAGSQALAEALRSSFGLIKLVMIALVLVFLGSGFFTVGLQERAIKLRLGKPVGAPGQQLLGPGLHWAFPYPIDEVRKIPITEIQSVTSTVGWYAATPEQEVSGNLPPPAATLAPGVDGYLLTGDGNILHSRAVLYYRINDPIRFVFDYASATNTIRDALDNALVYAAASFKVDDVLTKDIAGFRDAVRRRATELIDAQEVGVLVEQCDIQSRPPRYLADAFNRVLQAEQTRGKVLNEARSYENQVLSRASADAASRVNAAESERVRLVEEVASRAQQFTDLLPMYRTNTVLFVQQRLNETIARALPAVQDKFFLPDRIDGKTRELRLLLNREPPKPKTEASGQ
jgi:membrane protease subunit HflK